jgi:formylglycine-generating enzyme required for sulfatase activity
MVSVPAGSVVLTDRRSRRSWAVEVAAHRMSAFPVTQTQYAQVTGEWPSTARGDRLPVEGVSWWDADAIARAAWVIDLGPRRRQRRRHRRLPRPTRRPPARRNP